jgi:DNA repair exonuclease SbcCD ATPase subunit
MLEKLQNKNFGIHKDLTVEFQEGINAIIGQNRTGKTQLMESICFGLYGKTQNSRLEKIINFDADKAEVDISLTDFEISRSRTKSGSSMSGIKKLDLDNKLNLQYQEFLSIFYISSHEQKSLFDPSYLRQFLISIFDLDKYSRKHQELKAEYRGLKAADVETKKPNIPLIKRRFAKVKGIVEHEKIGLEKYETISKKITKALNQLASKEGELNTKKRIIKKKYALLKSGKCPECSRPYDKEHINNGLKKAKVSFDKIKQYEEKFDLKRKEYETKDEKCDKIIAGINRRINRARRILTVLKERSRETSVKVNTKRIKELEQIIPIFDPKGFPSYLLQVYVPVITQTANNLLNVIFPDTVVDIRTEKPESNRPDFKPFIHRGEEILEMKDLSGSERVLVNLCFRLGIMVIFKRLCNTCIDFFMVDEGFEKVDNDNALKVMKLFENFFSMGFLKQVILVTHKDILKTQENINYIELRRNE